MMQANISTETMATATGLDTDRSIPETMQEIEREQQACKDGYLRSSLKLRQMQINTEIEKVESSKCKLGEFKREILQHVDAADKILAEARTKVDQSETLSPDESQTIKSSLTIKRGNAEAVFLALESKKNVDVQKLSDKLKQDED